MCGVFGWITTKPLADSRSLISAALTDLAHRGPDGAHAWFGDAEEAQIVFGHRRLAIIDLSTGDQPLRSHDGRFVITFNGEIYNYIELREQLRAQGHRFNTGSDTEVILEAYRAWGEDCLTRLRGMFAFALYDRVEHQLVLARDPFGKKPLYVAALDGGFAFSSEVGPLLSMPGVNPRIRDDVVGEYLLSRYVAGPRTFFQGVNKLPPGHLLVWRAKETVQRRYFHPPFSDVRPEPLPMAQAVEQFTGALDEAVRIRMRSDAPFGLYLSGGLDSSLVLALMSRHAHGPVQTFSVGFEEAPFSELPFARQIAERYGADYDPLVVTAEEFFDHWEDAVRHRGAPVSEASDIPILLLSRAARSKVKMVLTGEGADELLGGYPKYQAERFVQLYHRLIPATVHRRLLNPLVAAMPYRFRRLKILSAALTAASLRQREAMWFGSAPAELIEGLTGASLDGLGQGTAGAPPAWLSASRELQLNDQGAWLADNLLERGDRMMMAGSIEGRMPFMDSELSRVVARFPDSVLSAGRGKLVAREAAKSLVGPEIIRRKKNGFTVPLGRWFRTSQRERLRELICSSDSQVRSVLDAQTLDRILGEHLAGRQNHEKILWAVGNMEIFLRLYGKASARPRSEPRWQAA